MRIKHFRARAVHGYMDFDITFNDDLTFLTGINGSGKTTVVNGVSALITPSLKNLANTDYERMEVEIHDVELGKHKKQVTIWSVKDEAQLVLGTSQTKEDLRLQLFPSDIAQPPYRREEKETEYYSELETEQASHPVMELVRSLPSPMLLGIERRTADLSLPLGISRAIIYRARRRPRTVFGGPLSASLYEAIELAEMRYREVDARQKQLTENLRKNILLSALKYEASPNIARGIDLSFLPPDAGEIGPGKEEVLATLQQLGLAREDFEPDLQSFFDELAEVSRLVADQRDFEQIIEDGPEEERAVVFRWAINSPQFRRITKIVSYIEEFIEESREANQPIDRYLSIVNAFLKDCSKELSFDETGTLNVKIRGSDPVPVTSLSSGETQIVVIISHLSFNPAAQLANVFIVDEPELSLHVHWQELFVKAVTEANPNLQVILATHSPSIILDDIEHCVDLSKGIL